MSIVTCHITISVDGFFAGPNQSLDNSIGEGGLRLHGWLFPTKGDRDAPKRSAVAWRNLDVAS